MPMAFAIGLHPVYEIAANCSGPHVGYDELALGAGVLGEPLEMVKCETIDLEVPAHAEIVIEGLVPPGVREPEGPFGEFTGFQGGKIGTSPVMEVTAITHRRNPIFRHIQATVYTDHQALVALPMEAALYHRVRDVQGGIAIHDVHVPSYAALFTVFIKMTPRWDGQAMAVGLAALSSVNLHPKTVVLVDEDVDIYDPRDVWWAVTQRMNPQVDVHVIPNQRIHPLDQSVPTVGDDVTVMRVGGKLIIDATMPPTWRPKARADFTRVRPSGFGDASLDAVLAKVRQHTR
jgi:2,5-furandicarboxylate decarboxylase 1